MQQPKWIHEFSVFIEQRNVLNLAVGVVLGTAFGQIVNSLVNNIIMPLVGILLGGVDVAGLSFHVGEAVVGYGLFLQGIINFLIIAFCIFWFVKAINTIWKPTSRTTESSAESAKRK
jgi:large conductance mechanosensitive channel